TICSGVCGTHIVSASSAPKIAYSFSGMTFEKKWTPYIIAPPATFANISQPLWRKNEACCDCVDTAGAFSIVSADMSVGQYAKGAVQGSDFRKRSSISFPRTS